MSTAMDKHYDVIIVGAGMSGIGAAYHLKDKCPELSFTILEARDAIGGTWDLFKYPGIRSDSDMYTFGYRFAPWNDPKPIADGASILSYVNDTADRFDIRRHIAFNQKVVSASWSSENKQWQLRLSNSAEALSCNFLFMCSGYYNYDKGHLPEFPGITEFKGSVIHPQHWDDELDYQGKSVVIIGSGATAVTLLPALAKKAQHVTMLQRSPTYMMSRSNENALAFFMRKYFGSAIAHRVMRWRNILMVMLFYKLSKAYPEKIKGYLQKQIQEQLGDKYVDGDFDPRYNPWDERLCVVPDNDLFDAIDQGKASIVTDTIEKFTSGGIRLKSGKEVKADVIVTATGLNVQLLGGMKVFLDNKEINIADTHAYRGVLLSGVPNFALNLGYTNASWTLKSDLNSQFVTRVLRHMQKKNYQVCMPKNGMTSMSSRRFFDLDSNYLKRAQSVLPKQGDRSPWTVNQNHLKEWISLKLKPIRDNALRFE